jgi:hypothetical protein
MILFRKKPTTVESDQAPLLSAMPAQRPEPVEVSEAARRKKADTDGTRRRARQTVDENRLL